MWGAPKYGSLLACRHDGTPTARVARALDRVRTVASDRRALQFFVRLHQSPGDAYEQTMRCFAIIADALSEFDVGMDRVVRTRMFVTDIDRWEEYGRAHAEVFGAHPCATTLVEVARLIDPEMLIEVEADAVR